MGMCVWGFVKIKANWFAKFQEQFHQLTLVDGNVEVTNRTKLMDSNISDCQESFRFFTSGSF